MAISVILTMGAAQFDLRQRFDTPPAGGERVDLRGPGQALAWLRQHPMGAAAMAQLHQLLGGAHGRGLVDDEHEVLRRAADALHDGRLVLYRPARAARGAVQRVVPVAQAESGGPQRAAVSGPGRMPPPRTPAPSSAAEVETDALDDVDQDAQAAALEAAARDGVPFCAVCERAKQQRAAEQRARDQDAAA